MRGGDPLKPVFLLRNRNVFPACAGVILSSTEVSFSTASFPRMRGGDPTYCDAVSCTDDVFPACAGVILFTLKQAVPVSGFPRMRGGDPLSRLINYSFKAFSPHARG